MALFIAFVLLAVLLGAGSMLAPVWSADHPPNGLTATLLLAVIIIGALLWMQFNQWDALIIDYLVFGIVSAVVLGGTMVQIQEDEAEDDSAETHDITEESSSRFPYLFWGMMTVVSALTVLLVPSQNTASDNLVVDMQSTLSLQALTPDYPQLEQVGASGFYVIALYLAEQLRQPITDVYPAVMTAITLLIAVTAYDLGRLRDAKWGYALAIVSVVIVLSAYALIPTAYLHAFVGLFALSLLTYITRLLRHYSNLELIGLAIIFLMLVLITSNGLVVNS